MKVLLRVSVLALVLLGVSLAAHAQAGATPSRGNISGFGAFTANASDGLDGGHGFGFSAAYFFTPAVGIEGGFRRQSFDVTGTEANAVEGGELAANIVTINVVGRFGAGTVQPYVTGGVAILSNDYTTDPTLVQQLQQFNFSPAESFDGTAGLNVGGGIDFAASASIGLFVEGRFIAATIDTTAGLTDDITGVTATSTGEQDFNVFTVSGGVRILF